MKKLVVVVVVVAAILLLAPFGVGKVAEKRMNAGLDQMVEQLGYLVVADRKWTGGWFKSRQEVTFEVAPAFADLMNPEKIQEIMKNHGAGADAADDADTDADIDADSDADAGDVESADEAGDAGAAADDAESGEEPAEDETPAKPLQFKVFNDVLHGPVLGFSGFGIARVDTSVDLSEDVKAKIREVFGPKPALEIRTRVGFFGGGTTSFTSEGRKLNTGDESVISYDTFKVAVGYGRNFDSYDLDGRLPKLEAKGTDGGGMLLTSLTFDGDGTRVMGDLYDGDIAMRVEEIKIEDPSKNQNVSVEDIHYIVDTRTKDGFVSMGAKLGTGEVKTAELSGTGLEIKEIHYDFSLRKLHAESMDKMMKGMRDAYVGGITKSPDFLAKYTAAISENSAEILKHDPELGLDRIGFVTPEGEGVLKGVIKFVGVTPEDFSAPGGMALIGKLDADLTIEVAVKLAEKIPNGATMAGAGVDSGYIKRDGDKYVCRILFKDGELTINGKSQPIPGLGGPPGGAMGNPHEMPPGE